MKELDSIYTIKLFDTFQDKYFSGIDLDLSKALFVFAYNDVDSIDKIFNPNLKKIKPIRRER